MLDLIRLVFGLIVDLFRSRAALEAEILVLRQQIIVLRRRKATRLPFTATDRLVLGWVCRLFPKTCDALAIVRPETVVRWHRAGFRSYWRWKSSRRSGRPVVSAEIRQLIREMSIANPLWGAPRRLFPDCLGLDLFSRTTFIVRSRPGQLAGSVRAAYCPVAALWQAGSMQCGSNFSTRSKLLSPGFQWPGLFFGLFFMPLEDQRGP